MKYPEARIQADIVSLLQDWGILCHSVWNEGGGKDMIRTAQAITTGLRPGVADLVLIEFFTESLLAQFKTALPVKFSRIW